jgi:hypothetical protein
MSIGEQDGQGIPITMPITLRSLDQSLDLVRS